MDTCPYEIIPTNNNKSDFAWKYFLRQVLVSGVIWINIFLNGMGYGGPTVFIPQIRHEANSTEVISETKAPLLVSIYSYASIPWVIIFPISANYFGRKKPYVFVCAAMFVSTVIFYTSTSVTQILISETIEAVVTGSFITIASMILTEYTSPKFRGFFLAFKSATFCWGMWVSNAIGTYFHWKLIGLVKVIFSLFPVILVFFWPESPYWLASKRRFEECAESHRWLKGIDKDSELELEKLISFNKVRPSQAYAKYIFCKEFYKATLIGFCSIISYAFSGKIACGFYSLVIIKKMTSDESAAYTGMLILDGVTVFAMYIGTILSRFMTRRSLFFSSSIIGIVSLYALSLHVYLVRLSILPEDKYVSIALLSFYSIGTACGPVLFSILFFSELLPLKCRSLSMCLISIPFNFLMGSLTQLTPIIIKFLGLYSAFLFFGITLSICVIILYFYLPETKDKSLCDIVDNIRDSNNVQERNTLVVD